MHPNKNFFNQNMTPVYAHLWVYASRYPPEWDCTPVLDDVFSDLKYAGLAGVEIMEVLLRHDNAVERFNELIHNYDCLLSALLIMVICGIKISSKKF